MKLFILFFYIGVLSLPLLAQRIIVTKTANKSYLKSIHAKLQTLHIKMYLKRYKNYYFIYTKEYQTTHKAEDKLRKVRTLFPSAKLEGKKDTQQKIKQKDKQKSELSLIPQEERKWIVGVGIGSSSISGNIDNNTSFSDSGNSYSLKVGYFIKEYFLSTFSYSSSSVKQTSISNFYLSENYYYDTTQNSDIYIGALLGYSRLIIASENSTPSGSAMYGVQVGASYDILGYIPLSLTYQGIFLNHTISFTSTTQTSNINTNFQNVVELGIAYKF